MKQELDLIRIAMIGRQADAQDRADRFRTKVLAELLRLKDRNLAALGGTKNLDSKTRIGRIEAAKERLAGDQAAAPLLDALQILDAIEKQYGNKVMDKAGGETAEQLLQAVGASRYSDPVLRLMAKGHLTIEQVLNAREIASICRSLTHRSQAKTSYFPVASAPDEVLDGVLKRGAKVRDFDDYGAFMALLHSHVYLPWSDKVRPALPLIFGICVEGRSVEEVRRAFHLDWNTVLERVRTALDAYALVRARFNPDRPVKQDRIVPAGAKLPLRRATVE